MNKYYITLILALSFALIAKGQTSNDTTGEYWMRQELHEALTDTTIHNIIRSKFIILDNKEKLLRFAEPILFDIYGKKQIESEKPYDVWKIDDYWIIQGAPLPKGWKGGVFLMIVDSRDCRIIRITHGK